MVSLSFDPEEPPEQPPVGCTDPLLWHVSRALHQEHQPEPDGRCGCGDRYPCQPARLAARGLLTSCTRRRLVPDLADAHRAPEVRAPDLL
jgi:hypothetical protein